MEPSIRMMALRFFWFAFLLTALLPSLSRASTCTPNVSSGELIQSAIDASSSGDTIICVGVGTYTENITLKTGITLQGEELARTIIDGGLSGTVITGAASASLNNIIITNGDIGISATSINGLTIQNVIITNNTTGISCSDSILTLTNNVIDQNTTGILGTSCSGSTNITLNNTILSNNGTDISLDGTPSPTGDNNLIYNNTTANYSIYFPNDTTSIFDLDPRFVNSASNDYHLQAGSPAINTGTGTDLVDGSTADIGAYGGPEMDVTPFPVSGFTVTSSETDTLSLSWSANNAYSIAGYKLYFDSDASGSPYEGSSSEGPSPVNVGNITSFTLSGLSIGNAPTSPTGLIAAPGDKSILISWAAVNEATGYILYYGTSPGNYTQSIDVGNTTSYLLTGLTNGTVYYMAVSAYAQPTFYLGVTAYDDPDSDFNPDNESALTNEIATTLTAANEGAKSLEISEFPEEAIPFPSLEDEDKCFIATAVYGSNLEPQVVILRRFRDHYLSTNPLGRQMVAVYYRFSPPLAEYIRNHEALKPAARITLLPFIGMAWFILNTSFIQKILLSICLLSIILGLILTKKWKTI